MSCCIEPKIIIERLREGSKFTNNELAALCVVSLCDKLRAEVRPEDLEMVKNMLRSNNPYKACIGQVLVRPFLYKDGMKDFLIKLWKETNHEYLRAGLLFDLFEYNDLDKGFIEEAFCYLYDKREVVLKMLSEWLEGEDKIISSIQQKLNKRKLTSHKKVFYEELLNLLSNIL